MDKADNKLAKKMVGLKQPRFATLPGKRVPSPVKYQLISRKSRTQNSIQGDLLTIIGTFLTIVYTLLLHPPRLFDQALNPVINLDISIYFMQPILSTLITAFLSIFSIGFLIFTRDILIITVLWFLLGIGIQLIIPRKRTSSFSLSLLHLKLIALSFFILIVLFLLLIPLSSSIVGNSFSSFGDLIAVSFLFTVIFILEIPFVFIGSVGMILGGWFVVEE